MSSPATIKKAKN